MAAPKPNVVDVWLFKGKDNYQKKVSAKVFGGIVSFPEADPTKPVVWLGQKSYTVNNMSNKRTVLFYDTMQHMLFKPRDMSTTEDSVDMVMQTSQNVLLAGKEAKQALGIEDSKSMVFNLALALAILIFIMFLVFVYLSIQHIPSSPNAPAATTTIGGLVPGIGVIPKTTGS